MNRQTRPLPEAPPTMPKRALTFAAALLLSGCAGLVIAGASQAETPADRTAATFQQLERFGDVFERVRGQYVDEVTDEQLVEAAIEGMLSSLDPHSGYIDDDGVRDTEVQIRGEFGGIGIEVSQQDGLVLVVSPIDETPAARAGLQANDLITHINDEPVLGLSLNEAVEKMRGPIGTEIRLTVRRGGLAGGTSFDVTLIREKITVRSVRWEVQEGDIGYIRITSFTEQTTPGLQRAVREIREQTQDKVTGYVLDLRNNPGGLLNEAISVSDAFLDQGEIVSTRGRGDEELDRHTARQGDLTDGKPVVVLINGGSASASEIVAGALQDHRRAILLGTKSFGKGSVQTIVPLNGHGAMRLTTARYYTPSGRSIQARGIEPDIEVRPARIEEIAILSGRSEADLRGALANPEDARSGTAPGALSPVTTPRVPGASAPTPAAPGQPAVPGAISAPGTEARLVDYQLERARDLLRGVALFQQRSTN